MTLDDPGPRGRLVVGVAASALEAGQAFGPDHDDLVLASYDELGTLPGLGPGASVQLLVAPGCEAALERAAELLGSGLDLALAADVTHHDLLLELMRRHGLVVEAVQGRTRGVSYEVAHGQAVAERDRLILEAVGAATRAQVPNQTSPQATRRRDEALRPARARQARRAREAAVAPRPVPPLVKVLERVLRVARGRRVALLGGLGFLALVLLVVALVAATGSPAASSLLVLLLGVAGAGLAGATLLGVLLLSRQVHRQTARLEEAMHRHEAVLRQHERRLSRRDAAAADETALTHDYLAALAAASAVQGRDLQIALQDLAAEQRR